MVSQVNFDHPMAINFLFFSFY